MKNLSILLTAFIMVGFSSNSEWTVLFDGKTVKGLRGYKQSGFPDSWEVVDGTLKINK